MSLNHISTLFLEKVRDTYLHQHVKKPTGFRGEDTPNELDLIFPNEKGLVSDIIHNAPLGNRDHEVLEFEINNVNNFKSHVDTKLSYWKGDYVTMNNELSNVNWNQLLTHEDVNENWSSFADKL